MLKNAGYIHSKSRYPVVGGDDTFQICYCIIKRGFHVEDVSIKIWVWLFTMLLVLQLNSSVLFLECIISYACADLINYSCAQTNKHKQNPANFRLSLKHQN